MCSVICVVEFIPGGINPNEIITQVRDIYYKYRIKMDHINEVDYWYTLSDHALTLHMLYFDRAKGYSKALKEISQVLDPIYGVTHWRFKRRYM